MGRRNKKRKQRDTSDRPQNPEPDYGVGDFVPGAKKRRLSSESPSVMRDSNKTPEDLSDGEVANVKPSNADGEDGWRTVTHKSSAKRDADGKKTKYPELVFHSKKSEPIRIADLQQLILYAFADGVAPTWVAVKHFGHIRKVVTLMVPGLEKEMFDGSSDLLHSGDEGILRDSATAETTNPMASESRSDHITDHEQRKREEYHAWKQGQPHPQRKTNHADPINLGLISLSEPLKPIAEIFTQMWPVKAPGDSKYAKVHSPLQAMLIAPISQKIQDKNNKSENPQGTHAFAATRTPISQFLHNADELRDAEYPIHPAAFASMEDGELEKQRRIASNQSTATGWVDSSVTDIDPINRPNRGGLSLRQGFDVYSIDCEMVLTEDEMLSLARISIVDWDGKTVLDRYVKPGLPIKNYFTQYSGITPSLLENVTTTLAEIQEEMLKLCTPSTILLGHSLESDLNALKFTHPYIVDTSLIYPHPRGPPLRSSLKYLANKYLRREIQSGGENGHNSVEDALAVLDLVKLKCEKGPKWGTYEANGEPIFRRLARSSGKKTAAIVDYGTPERGFGKEATHAIGCKNDDEVVSGVIRAVKGDPVGEVIQAGGVDFVWGRLRELESFRGWCNNNRDYGTVDGLHANEQNVTITGTDAAADSESIPRDSKVPSETTDTLTTSSLPQNSSEPKFSSVLSTTVSHIRAIHAALPSCTLFIVYSGTGDPREIGRLQKMQTQFRKEFKVKKWDDLSVKWTDVEEQALKRAAEDARKGVGFMVIK